MFRAKLLSGILAATAILGLTLVGLVMAETPAPSAHSALTGKVTSQAEGAMEGVIVGAKKEGSTITTWVVSNSQGQYSFPRERMEPGKYAISIRAVGYELPKTSVDVTADPAQLDLQLNKVTSNSKLVMQLSNGELLNSVPGSWERQDGARELRQLPHTAARAVFPLQPGGDGADRAADGHAHEQLFAVTSLDAASQTRKPADGTTDRRRQIFQHA